MSSSSQDYEKKLLDLKRKAKPTDSHLLQGANVFVSRVGVVIVRLNYVELLYGESPAKDDENAEADTIPVLKPHLIFFCACEQALICLPFVPKATPRQLEKVAGVRKQTCVKAKAAPKASKAEPKAKANARSTTPASAPKRLQETGPASTPEPPKRVRGKSQDVSEASVRALKEASLTYRPRFLAFGFSSGYPFRYGQTCKTKNPKSLTHAT